MNIILQISEFHKGAALYPLLGPLATLIAVLISGVFGVILFNKGVKKERKLKDEFREKEKNDIQKIELKELEFSRKHFITLVNGVVKNAIKQKNDYQNYARNLIQKPRQQQYPTLRTHENLNRLLKIDTQVSYKLFEHYRIPDTTFIEFLNSIDYLNEIFQVIPKDIFDGNGKVIIDLSQRLIEVRNEILTIASKYLGDMKAKDPYYQKNPLWNIINELVLDYYKDNDGIPSVEWDFDKLVTPIKSKLLTDELKYFEISNRLLSLSKIGGDIVFSITQGNTQMAYDILETCKFIDKECEKIKRLKEKFDANQ